MDLDARYTAWAWDQQQVYGMDAWFAYPSSASLDVLDPWPHSASPELLRALPPGGNRHCRLEGEREKHGSRGGQAWSLPPGLGGCLQCPVWRESCSSSWAALVASEVVAQRPTRRPGGRHCCCCCCGIATVTARRWWCRHSLLSWLSTVARGSPA